MCPAPFASTRRDPVDVLGHLAAVADRGEQVLGAARIVVGTRSNASSTANLSSASKFGKNSASTSNGVPASISSTNST